MSKHVVLCTSTHAVDLSDGRILGPGEFAEGIETDDDEHNAHLMEMGHIIVLEREPVETPRRDDGDAEPSRPTMSTTTAPAAATEPGGSV